MAALSIALGFTMAPRARAEIPLLSTNSDRPPIAEASQFRFGLHYRTLGTEGRLKSSSAGAHLILRDAYDSPRHPLLVDWETTGELNGNESLFLDFHLRGGILPDNAPERLPPAGRTDCSQGVGAGISGGGESDARAAQLKSPNPTLPVRINGELGYLQTCRTSEWRSQIFAGGRIYHSDQDSGSAPQHLGRLVSEVFLISEVVDRQQRRLAGSISMDTVPLDPNGKLESADWLGTFQLGVKGSHPVYSAAETGTRVHLGLDAKYMSVPRSEQSPIADRDHRWQVGIELSAGY